MLRNSIACIGSDDTSGGYHTSDHKCEVVCWLVTGICVVDLHRLYMNTW